MDETNQKYSVHKQKTEKQKQKNIYINYTSGKILFTDCLSDTR